jgi:predicted CopG family antitoxin
MKRRTQIYLDEDVYQALRKDAKRQDVSVSQIIREKLKINRFEHQKGNARKVLEEIEKLGASLDWSGTPKDLSENIDYYLYGK